MTRKPTSFPIAGDALAANKTKPRPQSSTAPQKRRKRPSKPTKSPRGPRAIPAASVNLEDDDFAARQPASTAAGPQQQQIARSFRWGAILASAFTGLAGLWLSMTVAGLIDALFARAQWLGWLGTGLLAVLLFAALVLILREIIGLLSVRKVSKIRETAAAARIVGDETRVVKTLANLKSLYAGRADMTWRLKNLESHKNDIIEPPERLDLAERLLLEPLDEQAGQIISAAARRVTLLTAVTPTAALDIAVVGYQNLKMLRTLARLYGGRPGTIATFRLAGMVVSHLAVAGGLALTDNLVQQFVGKGLLGRLSARFGEGAVNGILTTRIGLAALDLTRPLAFADKARPSLADQLKNIVAINSTNGDKNVKKP